MSNDFYFIKKKVAVASEPIIVELTSTTWATWTVPAGVTTAQILVVGGGGGGGGSGGGAGGGGVVYNASYTLTPGSAITYIVGAAGIKETTSGGTTYFNPTTNLLSAIGGGRGGLYGGAGGNGACGGGGGRNAGGNGGTGTIGFPGGKGDLDGGYGSGGGGGGMTQSGGTGGVNDQNDNWTYPTSIGGSGVSYVSVYGTSYGDSGWFGGGGAGYFQGAAVGSNIPPGGIGGGGNGAYITSPLAEYRVGKAKTGGGGGAAGDGGTGVILIKYTT